MKNKQSIGTILPVLFGFFIMGFCDVVGIATGYVKADFNLSETVAGFIPSMVFAWFLLFSVPTGMLMSKIGRKRMVLAGNAVTVVGMLIPFISYNFVTCMTGFIFLGIGNTILQVSLNPLLLNVVKGNSLTSSLTAGQMIKAVSSFSGPFIAAFAAYSLGNWQYLFPIFALITILSTVWLFAVPISEDLSTAKNVSAGSTFALLKNKTILLLFLGIVFVVGTDVGMNTVAPKLLMERCGLSVENAGFGSSVYFICRTAGAFVGAFLLAKMSAVIYYRVHIAVAGVALAALSLVQGQYAVLALVGLIGFACSSIFPVIYAFALKAEPKKADEISGLMITGIFGGALVPPLMGAATDALGNQNGSLMVIGASIAYLLFCSLKIKELKNS